MVYDTNGTHGDEDGARVERLGPTHVERVTEALIFAAEEPITAALIARVYSDITGEDLLEKAAIEEAVANINAAYEVSDRSFRINAWAGGYRMATVTEVAPYVQSLLTEAQPRKLTRSLMETVAILAYRQPVTKSEIDFVRGVDSDYSLRRLLEYGIIDVVGRSDAIGRPLLYGTTDRFLELFGLNSVTDLPNLRELEAILDDPAFQKERVKMLMTSGLQMAVKEEVGTGEESEDAQKDGDGQTT